MKKFIVTAFFNENHVDMKEVEAESKAEASEIFKAILDDTGAVYHWINVVCYAKYMPILP